MRGAWIEIQVIQPVGEVLGRRSPCGERGLKFVTTTRGCTKSRSLPMRGAWIEMYAVDAGYNTEEGRSPCGGVD